MVLGCALLTYAYMNCARKYLNKHIEDLKCLDEAPLRKESLRYALYRCTLVYLISFVVFQMLITFRRLYTFVLSPIVIRFVYFLPVNSLLLLLLQDSQPVLLPHNKLHVRLSFHRQVSISPFTSHLSHLEFFFFRYIQQLKINCRYL